MSTAAFASAHAFDADWRNAAERVLRDLVLPERANLGFLYFSDHYAAHADELLQLLRERTGIGAWAGSVGVGICGRGEGAIGQPGLAVLAARLPAQDFRVFSGREPLLHDGPAPQFAVVHADPHTPDMPELIADMAGKLRSGFLTGGMSSAREQTLQIANHVLSGGISGVAFTSHVAVATRLSQGCQPVGGYHRIDVCEENLIARIDGRPALDVFRDAAGPLAEDLQQAAMTVLLGLPVRGRDAGDYRVRSVIGVDPESGLIAINEVVEPGQGLLFVRRDGPAARDALKRTLAGLAASLPAPPRGALYFTCLGRGSSMFDSDAVELELIQDALGEVPLAGFFCSGEISHDQLYGYTGVLTLFL